MTYQHRIIEKKWQEFWEQHQTFATKDRGVDHPKYYVLDMFPYPSRGKNTPRKPLMFRNTF